MREFIQGPGETIYMPGNLAHAIMNIDENVSVTENLLLEDSLDDWIHGMMSGENLLGRLSHPESYSVNVPNRFRDDRAQTRSPTGWTRSGCGGRSITNTSTSKTDMFYVL